MPAGASITSGGNFTWTPAAGQVGPATFDVCVSDGTASDCETITVTRQRSRVRPRARRGRRHRELLAHAGHRDGSARLRDRGNVFTIGDNAYETGTVAEFGMLQRDLGSLQGSHAAGARQPRLRQRRNPGRDPYFDYFNGVGNQSGPAGDRALGYYSYNIGTGANTWHVVVLNSECESGPGTGCRVVARPARRRICG